MNAGVLKQRAKQFRRELGAISAVSLLSSLSFLALPWLAGQFLGGVIGDTRVDLRLTLVLLAAALIANTALTIAVSIVSEVASGRILAALRREMYQHLLLLPIAFHDRSRLGDLMALITYEVGYFSSFLTATLANVPSMLLVAGGSVVTAQLQFDRQSLRDPEWGAFVAEPLRGYAQEKVALDAVFSQDPDRALRETRRLVQRRPMPAEHLALLARAYALAGDMPAAAIAIDHAAARGWRDPLAQEAKARIALETGDTSEAARRFVALLIISKRGDAELGDLGKLVFADPTGPAIDTIAEILSGTDRWQAAFVQRGATAVPADAFVAVLQTSNERGVQFECNLLARAAVAIKHKDSSASDAADAVAALPCASRGNPGA